MSDPNSILDSLFPLVEVQKSATMSGAEMMARTGLRENGKSGPGRTGRPRKNTPELLTHPDDPALTAIVFSDEEIQEIKQGVVLQVRLADGSLQSIVLMHDTKIALLAFRESED